MEIYTSYFGYLNKIPKDITRVAICAKSPDWYDGLEFKRLAPSYDIFMQYKNGGSQAQYIARYRNEILSNYDPRQIVEELSQLTSYSERIVLLCYEKPQDFCHRDIVRSWLRVAGFQCHEYVGQH